MPDLKNPILKIERARDHLEALDDELNTFYATNPCEVTSHEFPDDDKYVIRLKLTVAPSHLSVVFADAIYCMRSALDQLAWQLALTGTDTPFRRTEFPVCHELTAENEARIRNVLQDVPGPAADVIRSLQPYHRGTAYKEDPLWRIDTLCNFDKHRGIPVHSTFVAFQVPAIVDVEDCKPEQIGEGEFILALPMSVKAQMERAQNPKAGVAFGSQEEQIMVNPQDAVAMLEYVRDAVIERFGEFFPTATVG